MLCDPSKVHVFDLSRNTAHTILQYINIHMVNILKGKDANFTHQSVFPGVGEYDCICMKPLLSPQGAVWSPQVMSLESVEENKDMSLPHLWSLAPHLYFRLH